MSFITVSRLIISHHFLNQLKLIKIKSFCDVLYSVFSRGFPAACFASSCDCLIQFCLFRSAKVKIYFASGSVKDQVN